MQVMEGNNRGAEAGRDEGGGGRRNVEKSMPAEERSSKESRQEDKNLSGFGVMERCA